MYVNEVSMDAAPVVNGFPAVPAIHLRQGFIELVIIYGQLCLKTLLIQKSILKKKL
jgi:hypothetical protein